MVHFPKMLKNIKKWFCVPVLFLMVLQQGITFFQYEDKFIHPIRFIKENYGKDYITQYGKRYEELKKIFIKPVHLTYIGEPNEEFNTGVMHYYLTQYFLTPNIILKDDVARDTILYNLYSSIHLNSETNFYLNNGWQIIRDFNNGLIVLTK